MINAVKRQCISHVVSGAAPEEELPSSVTVLEVEDRAATGPPSLSHHNKQHLGGAHLNKLTEETGCLYLREIVCIFKKNV